MSITQDIQEKLASNASTQTEATQRHITGVGFLKSKNIGIGS